MTSLIVRRLRVDLDTPLQRHWCGDAFRTAFFNALSMSFPVGEQAFIDSMKKGLAALPEADRVRFADEVQGFIGQEATHRHVHARFNAHLARQGLVNHWEPRIQARRPQLEQLDVRNWLAVTAATEHLTAVFAEFLLAHPQTLAGAEPRLATLWQWHSAEAAFHFTTIQQRFLGMRRGVRGPLPPPVLTMQGLWSESERQGVERMLVASAVGGPETVRRQLQQIVDATGADELIVAGAMHAHGARLRSYELLAGVGLQLRPAAAAAQAA